MGSSGGKMADSKDITSRQSTRPLLLHDAKTMRDRSVKNPESFMDVQPQEPISQGRPSLLHGVRASSDQFMRILETVTEAQAVAAAQRCGGSPLLPVPPRRTSVSVETEERLSDAEHCDGSCWSTHTLSMLKVLPGARVQMLALQFGPQHEDPRQHATGRARTLSPDKHGASVASLLPFYDCDEANPPLQLSTLSITQSEVHSSSVVAMCSIGSTTRDSGNNYPNGTGMFSITSAPDASLSHHTAAPLLAHNSQHPKFYC